MYKPLYQGPGKDDWSRIKRQAEEWMESEGALWRYNATERGPHILLPSGQHADGNFLVGVLEDNPEQLEGMVFNLTRLLEFYGLDLSTVDCVVGPADAMVFVSDMARMLSINRRSCRTAYIEKSHLIPEDSVFGWVKQFGEFILCKYANVRETLKFRPGPQIRPGDRVLIVENWFTSRDNIHRMADVVVEAGGTVLPHVATLLNSGGNKFIEGRFVVSLVERMMIVYPPKRCPLCKQGSKARRSRRILDRSDPDNPIVVEE